MRVIVKLGKLTKNWWRNFTMSAEEVYLSKATDIVDLEYRLQNINYCNIKKR